ncbi:MAG TPA: succinyl-diaminopimelate desuccinylase, partial [Pseudomonadales bacterium]
TEAFLKDNPAPKGRIAFLITSDEEGVAVNGTVKVMEHLKKAGTKIDYCLVGEPSSDKQLGDRIRVGRRGSLSGYLTVNGIQGHVAYPEIARNPIHAALPALQELAATEWDKGNAFFPPTSFQIANIHAGTGATNVIPATCTLQFNFRYCTEQTADGLKQKVEAILKAHSVDYALRWDLSGEPFLTGKGKLLEATCAAIRDVAGLETEQSTGGGTSDGRFIAPTGTEVIELGPVNATIHKLNECVRAQELEDLNAMYHKVLEALFR